MGVPIKPRKLQGSWKQGYALDLHTTASTCIGHNEYGHPVFDTTRSPLGELLYRLKYGRDASVIEEIVETVVEFINGASIAVDAIVPMPPSTSRASQPVLQIAEGIDRKSTR